jgi:hypothetical protein
MLASSLFIAAGSLLIGVIVIDLLWDVKTVVERPFTERHSEEIRLYYYNNLVYMAKKAPLVLAPFPLAFVAVVGSLSIELFHAIGAHDRAGIATAASGMALTFPFIFVAALSTIPSISRVEAGHATLPLADRHRLQRRVFHHHVMYGVTMAAALLLHLLR